MSTTTDTGSVDLTESAASTGDPVIDHGGVRIGTVSADGSIRDHRGVRIGSRRRDGSVVDHRGVHIGRIA